MRDENENKRLVYRRWPSSSRQPGGTPLSFQPSQGRSRSYAVSILLSLATLQKDIGTPWSDTPRPTLVDKRPSRPYLSRPPVDRFLGRFLRTKTGITQPSETSLGRNGHKPEETTCNLHCVILHLRIQTFLPSKGCFSIVFAVFRAKPPLFGPFFGTKTGITQPSEMRLGPNRHKSEETTSNLHCVILHSQIQTFLPPKGRFSIAFALFR